jgi:hypothetical protein
MSRFLLGVTAICGCLLSSAVASAQQQSWYNQRLTRNTNGAGGPGPHGYINPTVSAPYARARFTYPVITEDEDIQGSVSFETYATRAASATLHDGDSIADIVTTATAQCLNPIGVAQFSAQVDTNVSAHGTATHTSMPTTDVRWLNGAVVSTSYLITQNTNYDPDPTSELQGSIWVMGDINTSNPSQPGVGGNEAVVLFSQAGNSNVQADFFGWGWIISRNLSTATLADPTSPPSNSMVGVGDNFSDFSLFTQVVQVGTSIDLNASASAGALSLNRTGGQASSTDPSTQFTIDLKASGEFHVLGPQ